MTEFAAARSQPDQAAGGHLIYHDQHETSLPLLVLGSVIAVCEIVQLAWTGNDGLGLLYDWPTAVLLTVGFTVLWLLFRRRATASGLRHPPGFGLAALIGAVVILPPFLVTLVFTGPFLVFGLGLAVAGLRLRNRTLTAWGLAVGGIGVFEGFYGITNRLPVTIWAGWEHPAIYLALGLLTVAAGIIIRTRERRAAS